MISSKHDSENAKNMLIENVFKNAIKIGRIYRSRFYIISELLAKMIRMVVILEISSLLIV